MATPQEHDGMERSPLSSLFHRKLTIRKPDRDTASDMEAYRNNHLIICRLSDRATIIATVSVDDLFDGNGNRFYND